MKPTDVLALERQVYVLALEAVYVNILINWEKYKNTDQ